MENLKIDIKKSGGVIEAKLSAPKMNQNNGIDRIRLKTSAVKTLLEDKGMQPGVILHATNTGCLDNSESCSQYSLETTWIFEDLTTPSRTAPKNNKKSSKETAPKTSTSKTKVRGSKAKSQ